MHVQVQRLPRYRLLLTELVKHTPESAPHHADIKVLIIIIKRSLDCLLVYIYVYMYVYMYAYCSVLRLVSAFFLFTCPPFFSLLFFPRFFLLLCFARVIIVTLCAWAHRKL